jgi:hypothetical protein
MKKLILIMLFAFGMIATTFGQGALTKSLTSSVTADSATNADTAVLYCTVKGPGLFAIQAMFGRVSGTINAKAYIEYSLNGTSWDMYSTSDTFNVQPTSTAPKNNIFYSPTSTLPGYPIIYARVVVVNRSTSVLRLTAIKTKN